ncbi:hypothetical protein LXA12_17475, partial [Erwinia amylovora]|uniref:hypothetical protein n=1 Tax=Erwinia amylovora TaxID=552 RepID=UPI0020BE3DDA
PHRAGEPSLPEKPEGGHRAIIAGVTRPHGARMLRGFVPHAAGSGKGQRSRAGRHPRLLP